MKPGAFDRGEGLIESDDGFFHEAWGPGNRQGAGEKRIRGRAERREDRSRKRRCPNHDRRRARTSRFRGVQETVVAHGEEREKTKGYPFGCPRSLNHLAVIVLAG